MDVYSFVRFVLLMTITKLCQTKDIFKCDFHDTIDLTNAFRYDDKYFFKNHMFSPEVVEVYDYEETLDGHLVDREPHPRACFCNVQFCMKYCCNPHREWLSPDGRHCQKFNSPLLYNAKVQVLLDNGYIESHNVEDNFIITQGKVCENSKVVKPITVNWHIMENGSLLLADDKGSMVPRRDFCLMTLRTETDDDDEDDKQWFLEPFVCSEPDVNDGDTYTYNPNKEGTGLIGIISTPFILMTVVFHMVRPEHKNLRGKCLILCLASMAIGNTLLSAVSLSGALYPRVLCQTMGVMAYLFLESSFIWLTIIGYDMWRNSKTFIAIFNERKRFFKYLEYGCGIPLVLTTVLIFLRRIDLPDIYTPNMDREYCWWISYDWAGVLYYFGLNAFILLINFLFSALTLWKELPYMRKCEELRRYIDMVERSLCLYSLLFAIMASCFAFKMYVFMSDLLERNTSPVTVYIAESVSITEGPLIFFVLVLMPLSKRRWQGSSASITELEESLQRADTMESTYQAPIVITSQLK
ncbi:G-protein coupled receptor Mth2 [Stomoxys calcitrans]|uniref:G-protein coupled receptor Mth2 n=1 Tax=Stomoxys calcitrans TaxID=35570 RepID=UPI0027E2CEAD|nr:G-protein coupled receptor Mth2 [Stomoxys calcitrans]XP_059216053.1 G-protein coupled receptor Mth2 [Stomoxys calcitrans]XP_059216054.1 G-protein coupled receptor Mth2 [Stomoxys calcitrans]XP_059216055.1 G-protein coupled receptor Mth2 [Stomoxys calcitrans]XP_059216056.1 G-protein coupled receptor Mth2 [Stomoxys calcitrans]XP_059216057.1 G-protein coupled receptor Mth2 [Stomoxys calcitrans]